MDIYAMASKLYLLCLDMDYADYEETREQDIEDLENALFYLKTASENPKNDKCFGALLSALAIITGEA